MSFVQNIVFSASVLVLGVVAADAAHRSQSMLHRLYVRRSTGHVR